MDEQKKELARENALKDVKLYLANDWKLNEETPEYFLLSRNTASTSGHILIFLFFGWWSLGLINLLYHFLKREKKKIVK
jgi:hypothetical protein